MRVVQAVRSDSFAGVEQYVAMVSAELSRRGHDVRVIGGDPHPMRRRLPVGVRHQAAASTLEVARHLSHQRDADLVHVHMSAAEMAAVLTRPLLGAPVVATRHFAQRRGGGTTGSLVRYLAGRYVDRQVAISDYVASRIDGPATVIHSGVPNRPAGGFPRERYFLIVSRLEPEKDVGAAVAAFAESGLQASGWRLVVVGHGSQMGSLIEQASSLDLPGRSVDFLGFVDDVHGLMASATCLLAATAIEALGLAVVEAMAHATPVLAADGGAHPEILGPDGRYFPPSSTSDLARLMRAVAEDPDDAHGYGLALQARQRMFYDLERHVDRLEDVYREVVR